MAFCFCIMVFNPPLCKCRQHNNLKNTVLVNFAAAEQKAKRCLSEQNL